MIVPMRKYNFLVFHKEYNAFLRKLGKLGVVHIVEKGVDLTDEMKAKVDELHNYEQVIAFLKKRNKDFAPSSLSSDGQEILTDILIKQEQLRVLTNRLDEIKADLHKAGPWGTFSPSLLDKLKSKNVYLSFYTATQKQFAGLQQTGLPLFLISEIGHLNYFILISTQNEPAEIDAEPAERPLVACNELRIEKEETESRILELEKDFDRYAQTAIEALQNSKNKIQRSLNFENARRNTRSEADEKLMILEGWAPVSGTAELNTYLENTGVIYFSRKPIPSDKIPVLLKNNRFSRLFEPIGSLFSLPDYAELDLTVFFAPFFMLFFGFCLGDAGYGLLFIAGAGLFKLRAKKELKPLLSLIQFLGLGTLIFGVVSGTLFGINLNETKLSFTEEFRHLFLNPEKMFNLALILGGIQIVFGLFIRAANQKRQFGLSYALATYGWLIIILGSIAYTLLSGAGIIPKSKAILYAVLATGGFFILFFADPGVNLLSRIGRGVWDIYSTVTGIFGDLLSYIRLFALGLSSAILGFVINDIGLQIQGSSNILGPLFFVLFLIVGHTLNILISSLGSFVHPLRLTFVEFYKSAGFKGGGEEYKPFTYSEP